MTLWLKTRVSGSDVSATVWTRKPAVPNASQGPEMSMISTPGYRSIATVGMPSPFAGIRAIPHCGQLPGLSKVSLSHGSPHGGHTKTGAPASRAELDTDFDTEVAN